MSSSPTLRLPRWLARLLTSLLIGGQSVSADSTGISKLSRAARPGSLVRSMASISSKVINEGVRNGSAQRRRRATTWAPQPRSSPMSRTRLRT